jgi:hypothetical protein
MLKYKWRLEFYALEVYSGMEVMIRLFYTPNYIRECDGTFRRKNPAVQICYRQARQNFGRRDEKKMRKCLLCW